ncbi:MAG: exosome complex RNA-binding protein Rrp4 [Thermofilaceae archaeon]|jgi:exosome complex component RRP4
MQGAQRILVPGEVVGEKEGRGRVEVEGAVYKAGSQYRAKTLSVARYDERGNVLRVIPLKGKYIPLVGDIVIGIIVEVGFTSWLVDINSPYTAVLPVSEVSSRPVTIPRSDLSKILDEGDMILAKVISFDKTKDPVLTIKESKLGKIQRGLLVEISPKKVPRVIGRKGSMIKLIESMLDVEVVVGQNGRVLVVGSDRRREEVAALAIKKIEAEAHTEGLTSRIKEYIEGMLR